MKRMRFVSRTPGLRSAGFVSFGCLLAFASAAAEPGTIHWEPYSYETRTGDVVTDAEIGRLQVAERHDDPSGNVIDLAFVRFRSTADEPEAPIVWLAGGPGDFGSDDIEGPYLGLVRAFQSVADVIALDQRGTGLSRPLLNCPENGAELPLERPFDDAAALAEYRRLARECAKHFENEGIDLSAYNTVESARDVEALRRELGVERLNLYGASYGTHLAFAILREFPESVDRVVVSGVEGPDHTWKLPSNIDRFFARVFEASRVGRSATEPDLEDLVRGVLKRVDREPVVVELPSESEGGESESIVLGRRDFELGLRAFLGNRENIQSLPHFFTALAAGDFVQTASYLRGLRRVAVGSAMYYCMDCASGASQERLQTIERESTTSLCGQPNFPAPGICEAWPHGRLSDDFRAPLRSDRPTLFLSGRFDGHTPLSNAREVAEGFSRATHVVVDGGSHQGLELSSEDLMRRLASFFQGRATNDTTYVQPLEFSWPESVGEE